MTDALAQTAPAADAPRDDARAHGHDAPDACANCGTSFAAFESTPRFCPHCGQETTLHPPSVGEFLHEFVGHYVALEGALWKTLALLILKPGRLTREYFAGRRRQYVLPLRLYLSASFLFFVAVKLLPAILPGTHADVSAATRAALAESTPASSARFQAKAASAIAAAASATGRPASAFKAVPLDDDDPDAADVLVVPASGPAVPVLTGSVVAHLDCAQRAGGPDPCGWFGRRMEHAVDEWRDNPSRAYHSFKAHWMSAAPYAIFLMLPVYAAIVMLAYRGRRMLFGEHVVFSLHMHAFWFLAALVCAVLPEDLGGIVFLATCLYGLWALHEVYGGRWFPTLLRGSFISLAYVVLVSIGAGFLATALALA